MNKIRFIFYFSLLSTLSIHAQQNNNWYFGIEVGVTFNPVNGQPGPTPLLNSGMTTNEGSSSISDEQGNLLFYSNGVTIYNRNHEVMSNGTGLKGNLSSCQSVIIVPQPGNHQFFYVFTSDAIENSFANGYCYSIVDITLDNGNGAVISKNQLLWSSATERLTAARHANGFDIWIITNDNNSNLFRSWLLTCNGLVNSAVVSTAGEILNQHVTTNVGVMKVSPDGKQLCQTHLPELGEVVMVPNFAQIFDFNNTTGVISNARTIGFPDVQISSCEYSPDSKILYLSAAYQRQLEQVECRLPSIAEILSSRMSIPTGNHNYFAIQLAPDEKIYLCTRNGNFLSAIDSPNEKAPGCNYIPQKVSLGLPGAYLALPACINDVANVDPINNFTYTIVDSCSGQVQFNASTNMIGPVTWSWDFGDGSTSGVGDPVHFFNPANNSYAVTLEVSSPNSCGIIKKSRIVRPTDKSAEINFEYKRRCDSGYVRFINPNVFVSGDVFTWDFGDGNFSNEINPVHAYAPGKYEIILSLSATNPCRSGTIADTIDLQPFELNVSPDQTIVVGQSINLYALADSAIAYHWQPTDGLNDPSIASPIARPEFDMVYKVTAYDKNGCESTDSVKITVADLDDIFVPTGFTPNNDGINDRLHPFMGSRFRLEQFSVFNRWGKQVFLTKEKNYGWNGRINNLEQPAAVYVWTLNATDLLTGNRINRKGTFVLIR